MTTSPTLAKTVNDRAVMMIMTGALSDLDFTGAGHVVHCSNREEKDLSQRRNSAILIRVEHDGMQLTAAGAEFILENLDGCMSKHDQRALHDFERASYVAYQAEREVIEQHTDAVKQAAHDVAYALVNHADDYKAQSIAFQASHDVLADARAALTDDGYRRVVRAFHAHREEQRNEMRAR